MLVWPYETFEATVVVCCWVNCYYKCIWPNLAPGCRACASSFIFDWLWYGSELIFFGVSSYGSLLSLSISLLFAPRSPAASMSLSFKLCIDADWLWTFGLVVESSRSCPWWILAADLRGVEALVFLPGFATIFSTSSLRICSFECSYVRFIPFFIGLYGGLGVCRTSNFSLSPCSFT